MTEVEHSELDYRIATEVFKRPRGLERYVLRYSLDPTLALEVVEALRQEGWLVTVKAMPDGFLFRAGNTDEEIRYPYVVEAMWIPLRTVGDMRRGIHARCVGMADTLALAVCKCAIECIDARARFPVSKEEK